MPATAPITTPAIPPPERPDFDAEEVELTVVVAELAVFVVGLAERLCEEKVEKEDKDVLENDRNETETVRMLKMFH